MLTRRTARGGLAAILSLVAVLTIAVGGVSAHNQTVDPNGNGEGFTTGISQKWAQAHCHAAAPAVVGVASDGVVSFSPDEAKPCLPTDLNPGGQVTGP